MQNNETNTVKKVFYYGAEDSPANTVNNKKSSKI